MRRQAAVLLALVLGTLAFTGPSVGAGAANYTILLSMKGPGSGNPFWAAVERGAQDTAKAMGVNLVVLAPPAETHVQAQISQIEDQIAKRVNAIVVAPTDVSALNTTFDKARAQRSRCSLSTPTATRHTNSHAFAPLTASAGPHAARCAALR